MFGNYIKTLRAERRLGLREFCLAVEVDASNWSKIERGILLPPQAEGILTKIASVLQIKKDSDEWNKLFDYAAVGAGKIPEYVMQDPQLLAKLPVFFRTVSGKKPKREDLIALAKIFRKSE